MGWVSFLEDLQTFRDDNEALANEEKLILGDSFTSEEKIKRHIRRSGEHLKKLNELFSRIDRYLDYASDPSLNTTKALESSILENEKLIKEKKGEASKRRKLKNRIKEINKIARETYLENQQLLLRISAYEIGGIAGEKLPPNITETTDITSLDIDPKTKIEMLQIEVKKLKTDKKRLQNMLKRQADQ